MPGRGSNLKFRIAIFDSRFSKVEKSRSRHVVSSKFLARNETPRRKARKGIRGRDGSQEKASKEKQRERREKEGEGEKTMKKELECEGYRSGRWKGDAKGKAETYST